MIREECYIIWLCHLVGIREQWLSLSPSARAFPFATVAHPCVADRVLWRLQIFGCVLCAVGTYALNNQIAQLVGVTLPQGHSPRDSQCNI
jgi:hypothetical protein